MKTRMHSNLLFVGVRRVLILALIMLIGIMIGRSTIPGRDALNEIDDRNLPAGTSVWRVYDLDDVFVKYTGQSAADLASAASPASVPGSNICFPSDEHLSNLKLFQEELVSAIEQTIEPDSWYTNGGTSGMIKPFGRRLAIWLPPAGHAKIRAFISELRREPRKDLASPSTAESEIDDQRLSADSPMWRVYDVGETIEKSIDQLIAERMSSSPPAVEGNLSAWQPGEGRYLALQYVQKQLTDCIELAVEPESWVMNGGTPGVIHSFAHKLVVWNTPQTQEKVRALLAELQRNPRKVFVTPRTQESR